LITLGSNSLVNGNVGIGSTPTTNIGLLISRNITGGVTSYGTFSNGTIQSDVTTNARYHATFIGTAAASFTVNNAYGHYVAQTTIGAGSAISTQQAYFVDSTLIGATNNYGFRGAIPSGTNRWNLYMDGTANNYMAGSLGIGATSLVGRSLSVTKNITGAVTSYGIISNGQIQSDATSSVRLFNSVANTVAASFTLSSLVHYYTEQVTFGAGSTVTNQYGFYAESNLTGATNNYGFFGNIPSGTNRWNLYMAGTANNYMAGRLGIGVTNPAYPLDISGFANSSSGFRVTDGTIDNRISWSSGNIGFFGTISNHPIAFYTNITERARITSGGSFGIGTGASINASARLQVDSTTQGVLLPRMTATQRAAIASPAEGLIVVQTDGTQGLYLYIGAAWHAITML
jgi:hypothetical protein